MGTGSGDDDRTRLSFQPCAHTSGMPPFPISSFPLPSAPPPRCQVILPSHTPVPAHLLHISTPPLHEARDPSPPSSAWGTPSSFILPLSRVRAAHMALSPGYQKENLRPGRWGGKMGRQSPNLSVTPDAARGLSSLPLSHPCSSPALGTDLPMVIADDLGGRLLYAAPSRLFPLLLCQVGPSTSQPPTLSSDPTPG